MQRTTVLFLAAAMAIGVSAPACADYIRLGTVDVGFRTDMDTAYTAFGGRVEGLRFTASRSNIFCRSIIVRYDNGETQKVFSGMLDEHRPVDVDVRGWARRIDNIRFVCRSDEFSGGRIFIAAEVGRYMDDWRRDRDWDRTWSGMFGMGHGPGPGPGPGPMGDHHGWGGPDEWVSLGTMSFEGRNDKESNFTGWGGRHVDRLALRPMDGDARCMSIVATFENGQKAKLSNDEFMRRGEMRVFDLPGYSRNLTKVYLRCRAIGAYSVRIEVLARK